MARDKYSIPQRRRYIRLDTVFPVQFRLLTCDGTSFLCEWRQGFTNNVSKGGICLEVNRLDTAFVILIREQRAKFSLTIELPLMRKSIPAKAKVAWVQEVADIPGKYIIGLSYEQIDLKENQRLMHYAWFKRLILPVTLGLIILLAIGFALGGWLNLKLIRGNKALVEQLVKIVQDSSVAKQLVKEISRQRQELQLKLESLQSRIQTIEKERAGLGNLSASGQAGQEEKIAKLNGLIKGLEKDKSSLQEQLLALQRKETSVAEDLLRLDKKKAALEKVNLDKMYQWLQAHQNGHTGLVMSFEGDSTIKNWGFIYDQSLAMQAYTNFSDFERARRMLEFFRYQAQRQGRWFYNAYYITDGSPVEYTVQCGPNIWLGIGMLQYTQASGDNSYLSLAEEIAQAIMALQAQDPEGGLRGGPDSEWYSTEHNLDAYAFFNMLVEITGKKEYQAAREKITSWLAKHTYAQAGIPIKRGKGDSTIATDTYAWSIAALGPEKLEGLGMNPDRIMEFAEKNCSVDVIFSRPEGYCIKIRGFDFAPERNLARGGVVSSEWTAQMVIAFKIMSDYYYKKGLKAKGHAYEMKADEYLSSLGKMIISSPSPSGQGQACLPYATQELVDTGHGWMTPKGDSTGCIAGTAYTLFAYYSYNPLQLAHD